MIKYGGNAMSNPELQDQLLKKIADHHQLGHKIVLVHGGGPEIKKLLALGSVQSEFIGGHRKTTPEAMYYVQLALRGEVNGTLVRLLNKNGAKAVGLSAKDGYMTQVRRRYHLSITNGKEVQTDIGQVGDIVRFDPELIHLLLQSDFLPVLSPVAQGPDGLDYNINADALAGAVAAALNAEAYISLTDVDGLFEHWPDPDSRLKDITLEKLQTFCSNKASGGMLPKLESVIFALKHGAKSAFIFNGTKPDSFNLAQIHQNTAGTRITLN